MELDVLKLHTTWNDAANSINTNFSKIQMAIASLEGGGGGLDEDELRAFLVVYLAQNGYATRNDIDKAISEIVDGAPTALDTLKEIADALAQDKDSIGAILTSISSLKTKDEEQDREIGIIEERLAKAEQITLLFGEDEDGNVFVKNSKNFYTRGEISAGGAGTAGGGGGGSDVGGGYLDSLYDVELNEIAIDANLSAAEKEAVTESQVLGYDSKGLWVNKKTMYIHHQTTNSAKWTITHGLNKMPNVKIVDSSGELVYGSVKYSGMNEVEISFGHEFAGKAYLD